MIAFPGLLAVPAKRAGIRVPKDTDDFDKNEFPHFHVFLMLQLGRPMPSPNSHWENAKVVADIPDDMIRTITVDDVLARGFQ